MGINFLFFLLFFCSFGERDEVFLVIHHLPERFWIN